MIVYPTEWFKPYEDFADQTYDAYNQNMHGNVFRIVKTLKEIISDIGVNHLAYSGGVDSTILLCIMSDVFDEVNTYTISSREDNKALIFSTS